MRFVPLYRGVHRPFFPLVLAAAVDPGWSMVLWTSALFLIAEPVAGHIVEPLVYGHHTAFPHVAIVIAALFWKSYLDYWSAAGNTADVMPCRARQACRGSRFVDVLLGDEPALEPEERFYQRILAGDATEAADQAEEALKSQALSAYYDAVPMQALALAQADAARGRLDREKQVEIRDTIEEIVDDLSDYSDEQPAKAKNGPDGVDQHLTEDCFRSLPKSSWRMGQVPHPVLCVASRRPLDEARLSCWLRF